MGFAFICEGDTTTHGGRVVGCNVANTVHGRAIALLGDMVTCPRCGGIYARIAGSPEKVATMGPGDCDCSDDDANESPLRAVSEALSELGRSLRQLLNRSPASPPGMGGLPLPLPPIVVP